MKYFDEEDAITEYEKQLQKKDNEIERLKEEYVMLQNASDEVEEEKDREIERLNNNWNELRKWVVNNKHNENTKERYLVVDYGTLLGKMGELKGSEKK